MIITVLTIDNDFQCLIFMILIVTSTDEMSQKEIISSISQPWSTILTSYKKSIDPIRTALNDYTLFSSDYHANLWMMSHNE